MFKLIVLAIALVIAVVAVRRYVAAILDRIRPAEQLTPAAPTVLTQVSNSADRRRVARERIAAVGADQAAKSADVVYAIENHALFDLTQPSSRGLAILQQRAQDADLDLLPLDQLEALAAELRVSHDAAVAHAEQLGLAALGERRPAGERAAKLARKARSTSSAHERDALLSQCRAILDSIGLTLPDAANQVLLTARRGAINPG